MDIANYIRKASLLLPVISLLYLIKLSDLMANKGIFGAYAQYKGYGSIDLGLDLNYEIGGSTLKINNSIVTNKL